MEGIARLLGSSDQQKVPAGLSLFLESEKIPALFNVRKGPEYRSQIREGPVFWPFSYT
jgi:hypothetical protein